jgi:hypothetical protein
MFRPQRRALIAAAAAACVMTALPAHAADTIKIGLITALSGQSARAGEALTRGMTIAIDEINAKGGLLGGRKLELVRRDDEGNPAKGVLAARELIYKEKVAVLFGGSIRRCRWPSCRSPTRRRCRSWARGPPARRSRTTAPTPTCVPRLGRGRSGRQGDAAVRAEGVQCQQAGPDPGEQPVGRIERKRHRRRAGGQGRQAGGRREIRSQRRRRGAAAWAA